MHHDFELYSHEQEQQLQYLPTTQPYLPSSTYSMDHSFSAPFDHMLPLVEAPRPQYSYEQLAQTNKLAQQYNYHSPSGSPQSTFNSFQDQPPVLSASSESGASASSSALGSPSITPQFEMEAWNPMSLTSGFEYPAMVATEKSFVGKSIVSTAAATSFASSCTSNAFKAPTTPALATWSSSRSSLRRNSTPSSEMHPYNVSVSPVSSSVISSPLISRTSFSFVPFSQYSCWSPPSAVKYKLSARS